ncbi:MAG: hypothetical protein JXA21_01550 [Anaerolineae bacterium]|nr:hypothetical protein [Anaerolineae bacterium]
MEGKHIINIRNNVDVILMRTEVRNSARKIGMDMMDQASISLAASSLAHALGLGGAQEGQVWIERVAREGRIGLQVICTNKANSVEIGLTARALQDAKWMVDELFVEELSPQMIRVTMVKWMLGSA